MSEKIEALKAERDELIAANASATSWGAAVGARQERINEIEREIRGRTVEVEPAWDDEAPVEIVDDVLCDAMEGDKIVREPFARAIVAALREAGALK